MIANGDMAKMGPHAGVAAHGSDLTGFLGPTQFGVAPVNKAFNCFLPNASGVSYCKLECGRTVL